MAEKEAVLKIENLSKKFGRSIRRSMAYGTFDILRSMLGIRYDTGRLRKGEFWALQDINFTVHKGETFGLIGANGSGKSTLLRLINGIFPPDKGSIAVKGKIGALIAVGAGFHPHMTGRENIYLNGTILGMTKEEINTKIDSIIDFAEIGDFLDAPVSTYSSGMYVRLGFAIAIHSNPDIVLIDEILAVGDAKFQRKCLEKMTELRAKGTTFLIVSHNMQNIQAMCSQAVLLHQGKQVMLGTPDEIIPVYELLLQNGELPTELIEEHEYIEGKNGQLELISRYPDFGTDEITIEKLTLKGKDQKVTSNIKTEEPLQIDIEMNSTVNVSAAIMYLTLNYVTDRKDMDADYTVAAVQQNIPVRAGKSTISINLDQARLTTGEYKVGLNIFDETYTNPYTQGYYGYFTASKNLPTMLRVGKGTPFVWPDAKITIKDHE